jgi:hypothetical protein
METVRGWEKHGLELIVAETYHERAFVDMLRTAPTTNIPALIEYYTTHKTEIDPSLHSNYILRLIFLQYSDYHMFDELAELVALFAGDERVRAGGYWLEITMMAIDRRDSQLFSVVYPSARDDPFIKSHLFKLLHCAMSVTMRRKFWFFVEMIEKETKAAPGDGELILQIISRELTYHYTPLVAVNQAVLIIMRCDDARKAFKEYEWELGLGPRTGLNWMISVRLIPNINYIMAIAQFLYVYYSHGGAPFVLQFILQPSLVKLCHEIYPRLKSHQGRRNPKRRRGPGGLKQSS